MMQKKRTFSLLSVALKLGFNFGVNNIAIYGKKVRCSFNSFEQCTSKLCNSPISSTLPLDLT